MRDFIVVVGGHVGQTICKELVMLGIGDQHLKASKKSMPDFRLRPLAGAVIMGTINQD